MLAMLVQLQNLNYVGFWGMEIHLRAGIGQGAVSPYCLTLFSRSNFEQLIAHVEYDDLLGRVAFQEYQQVLINQTL